jgi:hypothetical protein
VIRTALRASDILMDRVWQLEKETFRDTRGFAFAPITDVVEEFEDSTALHPEIQRQVAKLRTDLDRCTPLEISSLVKHGYCVGRKACRARPEFFGMVSPDNPPWDPMPTAHAAAHVSPTAMLLKGPVRVQAPSTSDARTLQASTVRRIWSTLFDHRDWTSYLHVAVLVPALFFVSHSLFKYYQRTHRTSYLINSLSQGNRDVDQISRFLESRSLPWTGAPFKDVDQGLDSKGHGFEILQDSRIMDLREWKPGAPGKGELAFGYRRLKVTKTAEQAGDYKLPLDLITTDPDSVVRIPPQELQATLFRSKLVETGPSDSKCRWQAVFDLSHMPLGEPVDLLVEYYSPGEYLQHNEGRTTLPVLISAPTAELTMWIMLPLGKEYRSWRVVKYRKQDLQSAQTVKVVTEYLADDFTILAFKMLALKADYNYEVQWFYK